MIAWLLLLTQHQEKFYIKEVPFFNRTHCNKLVFSVLLTKYDGVPYTPYTTLLQCTLKVCRKR